MGVPQNIIYACHYNESIECILGKISGRDWHVVKRILDDGVEVLCPFCAPEVIRKIYVTRVAALAKAYQLSKRFSHAAAATAASLAAF